MNLHCTYCGVVGPEELFCSSIRCKQCQAESEQRKRALSRQKNIENACRELAKAFNSKSEVRDIPEIIEHFKNKVGGTQRVAEMLVEDFQRVRGENLTELEKEDFHFKEQVIQRYHQMMMKSMSENDETKVADMSGLSDDELKSIITTVALEIIEKDADFRKALVQDTLERYPDLAMKTRIMALPAPPSSDNDDAGYGEYEEVEGDD